MFCRTPWGCENLIRENRQDCPLSEIPAKSRARHIFYEGSLFFALLIWSWVGVQVLAPVPSVLGGAFLGMPATWVFARPVRRLMEEADR